MKTALRLRAQVRWVAAFTSLVLLMGGPASTAGADPSASPGPPSVEPSPATGSPGASQSPSPSPTAAPIPIVLPIDPRAVVFLAVTGTQDGHLWIDVSYGVVVDPAGLILAPATVVAPDAPGLAIGYQDPFLYATVDEIVVYTSSGPDQPLTAAFVGKVVAVDGYLDLAIVAPDHAVGSTEPLAPGSVTLPALSLATAAAGDSVAIVSAESTAGYGPTATAGTITGTGDDPRITSGPGWLIADAATPDVPPGGALVTTTDGALLTIETFVSGRPPSLVSGRPAALIQPLLDAARSGQPYTSPYVVPGTGMEELAFDSWTTADDPCAQSDPGRVTDYPSGVTAITALFASSGFTLGEDRLTIWYDPETFDLISLYAFFVQQASGCYVNRLSAAQGTLPDGAYTVGIFAGGTLAQVASQSTTVGRNAPNSTATMGGRVVDADTGQPIENAYVVLLDQGVDLAAWASNPDFSQAAAYAVTDANGDFETQPPVPPGLYPAIIVADGYQVIGGTIDLNSSLDLGDIALVALT